MLSPTRLPTLFTLAFALTLVPIGARGAASQSQRCEAAADAAAGDFAKCRLDAEAKNAKGSLVGQRFIDVLERCSGRLQADFAKAQIFYGAENCPEAAPADFDAYLSQCTDDVAVAAAGGIFPDAALALATCNAGLTSCTVDLGTVQAGLTSCTGDLGTVQAGLDAAQTDLGTCTGNLGTVQAALTACQAALPTPTPTPTPTPDGSTITDSTTGLMWEKLSDDGGIHDQDNRYDWANATDVKVAALNAAGYAGYSDWRLPSIVELQSIINTGYYAPAVSPAFNTGCAPSCTVLNCSCTISSLYWSSSTYADVPTSAWVVYFYVGNTDANYKTSSNYVRAVRGGS